MDDWQIFFEYYVMDERFIAGVLVTLAVLFVANLLVPPVIKQVTVIRHFFVPPKKPPKKEEKVITPLQQVIGCVVAGLWLAGFIALVLVGLFLFWSRG